MSLTSKNENNNTSTKTNNSLSKIPTFIDGIFSSKPALQWECTKQIRMLLTGNKPPIKMVVNADVIPRFIQFAQDNQYPELQYETIWALINIASGPDECTMRLVQLSTHITLINLLKHPLYEIKFQSIWALGNISCNTEIRDILLSHDILSNTLLICQSQFKKQYCTNFGNNSNASEIPYLLFLQLLNSTSWTLGNLCRVSELPTIKDLNLIIKCLQLLLQHALIYQNNKHNTVRHQVDEILSNIGWAYSFLTNHSKYVIQLINTMDRTGITEQFINLMDYKHRFVRHPILRVIGNILVALDDIDKYISFGILDKYYNILSYSTNVTEKKEICWAISNVTVALKNNLFVLTCNLHPLLINCLENEELETKKEALWAIANATCQIDKNIIKPLVRQGVIRAICAFFYNYNKLKSKKNSKKIILLSLEIIENILECGKCNDDNIQYNLYVTQFKNFGIVFQLEMILKDYKIDEIYDKCLDLLTGHFTIEILDIIWMKLKSASNNLQIRGIELICNLCNYYYWSTELFDEWINKINLIQIIFGPSESSSLKVNLLIDGYLRKYNNNNKGQYLHNDIVKLIILWYNDCQQFHLIKRCSEIIKYMIGQQLLDINHMDCIWNAVQIACGKKNNKQINEIYNVIVDVKNSFTTEQKEFMLRKLEQIDLEQFNDYHSKLRMLFKENVKYVNSFAHAAFTVQEGAFGSGL